MAPLTHTKSFTAARSRELSDEIARQLAEQLPTRTSTAAHGDGAATICAVVSPVVGDLLKQCRGQIKECRDKIEHLRRMLVLRDVQRHDLETEDRKMRALIGGHEKRLQYLELLERKNRRR
jgi:hypothetical protein